MHRYQRQLIHRPLGTQLLKNADHRIADHHAQKAHVGKAAHHGQKKSQHHKNQVEKGEDIFPYDLGFCFGGRGDLPVIQPCCHTLCSLFRRKAGLQVGRKGRYRRSGGFPLPAF